MQPGGFVPVVPLCGVYLSGHFNYPLTIIKVPVPVLFTNLKDTEWERWRGLCWGIVLACASQGSVERKLKWWLHKCTNGLQFLPAVPWAVNSRTASVWPAHCTSYPLFVQNKPMNSMCTLNWEDLHGNCFCKTMSNLNILSFTSLISFLPFHHITCALQPFLCNYVAYLPTLPLKSFFNLEWWNGEYTGFLSCLSGSCLKVQAWYEENILRGIPGGSLYIGCVWGQMCVVNCVYHYSYPL